LMAASNPGADAAGPGDASAAPRPGLQGLFRTGFVEQAVEQLRESILSGDIPPGTRLRQEQVAAQLGVSRTPLREAFRVLIQEGLLISVGGGGTAEVVQLAPRDARELYEVRAVLDGLAARLCAGRVADLPRAAIETNLIDLESTMEPSFDVRHFNRAHAAFHVALYEASGNVRLLQTLPVVRLSAQMMFGRLATGPERMRDSVSEHRGIYDAILAGDGDEAERLSRAHIDAARGYWLEP